MVKQEYWLTKTPKGSLLTDLGYFTIEEDTTAKTMTFEIELYQKFMGLLESYSYPDVTFTFQFVGPAAQPAVNGNPEAKFRLKIDDKKSPMKKKFMLCDIYTISGEAPLKDLRIALLSVDVEYYDQEAEAFVSKRDICDASMI